MKLLKFVVWCISLLFTAIALAGTSAPRYHLVKEIPIGGEGGWDMATVDPVAQRLYLAQSTRIVVVDLKTQKVMGEVTGILGAHGFAFAPELGFGFATGGKESKVSMIDLKSLKILRKIPTGDNPDAIVYDTKTQRVFSFNGKAKSATVIQAKSGEVVATIALSGKPEYGAIDPDAHHLFVNLEDQSQIAEIDTQTHKITANWSLAPCEEPSGLAIDLDRHRLFAGCDNHLMVMLSSKSGKVLGSVHIGSKVDANSYDPELGLAFSSNGEGNVTIAQADAADSFKLAQTLTTEPGARTMALDSSTHRIYLASAKFEAATGGGRPKVVPGTLKILVYAP